MEEEPDVETARAILSANGIAYTEGPPLMSKETLQPAITAAYRAMIVQGV